MSAFDFDDLESAESAILSDDWGCAGVAADEWKSFLQRTDVYALVMPERAAHITALLSKWGFANAVIFYGILKETIRMDAWAQQGRLARNNLVHAGRVACHFGHRAIMEEFVRLSYKDWLLIFEDDLEDTPAEVVQCRMLEFLMEVPQNFDLLHLGFLWESQEDRVKVSKLVYRTHMGVGRHAYMVSRRGAQVLLKATYPQIQAGDEMYREAIVTHELAAYQPLDSIFRQDREKFISRLTESKRMARQFRPSEKDLKKWQAEAENARERIRAMKSQYVPVPQEVQDMMSAALDDKKKNPPIDLSEPLLLVGNVNDWCPELAATEYAFSSSVRVGMEASALDGTWKDPDKKSYNFHLNPFTNQIHIECKSSQQKQLSGKLKPQAHSWEGTCSAFDGSEMCDVSLVLRGELQDAVFLSFKKTGQSEWSQPSVLYRTDGCPEVEHQLRVHLKPGNTEFQIISARTHFDWRLFPQHAGARSILQPKSWDAVPVAISTSKDNMSQHGRNFWINEPQGGDFVIKVRLQRRLRLLSYEVYKNENDICQPQSSPGKVEVSQALSHAPSDITLDLIAPVRLVGDFVNWDLQAPDCELQPVNESEAAGFGDLGTPGKTRQHRICVCLRNDSFCFQIASSKLGFHWRGYPALSGLLTEGLDNEYPMTVGGETNGHGKNFIIREPAETTIVIIVSLSGLSMGGGKAVCVEATVAYKVADPDDLKSCASVLSERNWSTGRAGLTHVRPLRLVGKFSMWNLRTKGIELEVLPRNNVQDWEEHRLCCRLLGDHLDFQLVSSALGFQWRCYPQVCSSGLHILPRGRKNQSEVIIGGEKDGHGRHFSIQEAAFSVICISVWLRTNRNCNDIEQVMVTYELQQTGCETVGIGPGHVVFPITPACPKSMLSLEKNMWMHLHPIRETGSFAGVVMLRSVRSGHYLHSLAAAGKNMYVVHSHSTSDGSKWQVDFLEGSKGACVFLKNLRSGQELHVRTQEQGAGGRVAQWNSRTAGSQWHLQHFGAPGSNLVALRSVRSGCFLTVPETAGEDDDPRSVYQSYARSSDFFHAGNVWEFEREVEASPAKQ